jgi:hypothetical protein
MASETVRFEASTQEHAESLGRALDGFHPNVINIEGSYQVELQPDGEVTAQLVELFETVGGWLLGAGLTSCQVHFGERSLAIVAPPDGSHGDPTQFLLERTRQLQSALETRITIEQAKGILAERFRIDIDRAFELLRRSARSHQTSIHALAARVIEEDRTPDEIQPHS